MLFPVDSATTLGLAANVVAICAVVAGLRQSHDTLRTQRRLADLGHVRGLLDDAAVTLHRTAYVLDEVRSQVTQHTPGFFTSEKGAEVFADLERCGRDFEVLLERLRIRFGDEHAVVASSGEADEAVLDIYRAAGLVRLEDPSDGSPAAEHEIARFYKQTRERLVTQRERFDEARHKFVEAAHAVAGAELGAG